ncbi:MFS transporter [Halobacterium bonnevillei]|uniref:MFS transporter n=1 Tax=Halobacterium bonnevillei TaxID=2692200 RepID=A0A6B0SFM1_9EURY|nr:MFS transporter [Halobacterium bonnevillei]MXR20378.1 MFS transporter [Halobacterium bonnevillei]
MSDDGSPLSLFRNAEFVALSGTAFARSQAYSTILIALALYADVFGTTGVVEGLWGTSFAVIQFLIVLPLGRAVDTGNAKRWLLAGFLVNVAVFVGFIFVSNPIEVILVRVVQGVGASILWITGATVVGEIATSGARGRWLGVYNQVAALSSVFGDLVGGYLLHTYDFTLTYVFLSAITLGATLLVWVALRDNPGGQADPEERTGLETLRGLLDRPMVQSLVAFRVAFSIGKMSIIIFLPIYARTTFGVDPLAIGGILAGGKLAKAGLQGYMGDLTDRFGGEHRFVLAGALLYAVGVGIVPLAAFAQEALAPVTLAALGWSYTLTGPVATLFVAYLVLGVADSIRLPASMSLFVQEGEHLDSVASSMSLRSISWKVGQIAGPVVVGAIKDLAGPEVAFATAGAFIVGAAGVFVLVRSRSLPAEPEPMPND